MKKLMLTAMVLGSSVTLAACAGSSYNEDVTYTDGPYSEERTIGATEAPARVVRSAAPVFEETQMK